LTLLAIYFKKIEETEYSGMSGVKHKSVKLFPLIVEFLLNIRYGDTSESWIHSRKVRKN